MNNAPDQADYDKLSKQDLIRLIKTKDVELLHLRKSLEKQSFDPSVFLNTKIRDIFWDKVKNCESFSSEKYELMSKFQTETQRNFQTIGEKDSKIATLLRTVEGNEELMKKNELLEKKIDSMNREFSDKGTRLNDLHSENHYLQREIAILKEKVNFYEGKVEKVESYFAKEKDEYEAERKKLSKRIAQLTNKRSTKKAILKITSEFKASEIFYSNNNQYNIEQIVLRLNTVNAESTKYVELLTLVKEFHVLITEELREIEARGVVNKDDRLERDKLDSLLVLLASDRMCNNYIKGLNCKDQTVFKTTIDFLLSLGEKFARENYRLFEDDYIVTKMCEELRQYSGFENKKKVLNMITYLITYSEVFNRKFVSLGGIQILIAEFSEHKDPVFINSEYFGHLLKIMRRMIPKETEFADFMNVEVLSYFVKLLSECYNKTSLLEIIQILNYLAQKPNIRKRLIHFKIFKKVISFYEESWHNKDFKLLFSVFLLFGKFTREDGFKMQLISHFEIQNDVSTLYEPFKDENSHLTTIDIKSATLEIIRNLIIEDSPSKMREALVKSTFLKSVIQACLNDEAKILKNLALDCLISVNDFVLRGVMKIDDIIIDLENIYNTQDSIIQSKLLLFLAWGLKEKCIDKSVIKQELIIKIVKGSLLSLETGEGSKFRKEFLCLYLLLDEDAWRETILSVRYFESLITARVSKTKSTIKAWFNSIVLVLDNAYLNPIFKSNPNYLKFIWIELTENFKDNVIEVLLIVRACIYLEPFRAKFQDTVFISLLFNQFVSVEKGIKSENILFICYEIIHYLANNSFGKELLLKHKGMHDCFRRRLRDGGEICKLVVRILHPLVMQFNKADLELLVDRELVMGLNQLIPKLKEFNILGFMIEINQSLVQKEIIPLEELKFEKDLGTEIVKMDLATRFNPKRTICEEIIEQMVERFKLDYLSNMDE
jgi:hypothetical protein